MRHLATALQNGLRSYPSTIAELGPGDSIGIGLAALIGGARQYFALEIVQHANSVQNAEIFDEIVALYQRRESIPTDDEFPQVHPRLKSYAFPEGIFSDEKLKEALNQPRISELRRHLLVMNGTSTDAPVRYICPWFANDVIRHGSVDMIFSQAVLEHVDDLDHTYNALYQWLRPGGMMSHQIDFRSHKITPIWNGHWLYSDFEWRLIRGRRPYLLNREPLSTHLKYLDNNGFQVLRMIPVEDKAGIEKKKLAQRYRQLSDEDLRTSSAHIICIKE